MVSTAAASFSKANSGLPPNQSARSRDSARVAARVTFGEIDGPPRTSVAFLLTARREIVAARDRRKSANHATLRATRRLVALSVFNAAFDGPNATPRVTSVPPQETLKLSASLG